MNMPIEDTTPATSGLHDPVIVNPDSDGEFEVLNLPTELPAIASAAERTSIVRAAAPMGALPVEAWRAVARAVTSPGEVADQLTRAGSTRGLMQEPWQPATLGYLQTTAWLTELFVGPQPRTGAGVLRVRPPRLTGALNERGEPTALLVLRFDSRAHLRDWMRAIIIDTRNEGERYDQSILHRRIGKALMVHAARLEIADTGEALHVLMVRDGISRLVSSWAALTGIEEPGPLADWIVDSLLGGTATRQSAAERADHARRGAALKAHRAAFIAGTSDGRPSMEAVRAGQTLTVPVQAYLTVRPNAPTRLAAPLVFNDAVRAAVASIHTDVRQWRKPSKHAETIDRALERAAYAGAITDSELSLATAALDPDATPTVFGDPRIPPTALWRAVYLIALLCRRSVDTAVRRHVRDLLGRGEAVERTAYVAMLATVVDQPWRSAKDYSLSTARTAWANGGPIPSNLLRTTWRPVPVADFRELVPLAGAGDRNALATLQVAGGIALVADKLITANVGSAEGRDGLIRKDVNRVVADLGRTESGLWLLAHAANAFSADRPARNSFTSTTRLHQPHLLAGAYVVPAIAAGAGDDLKTDAAGGIVELTAAEVLAISELWRTADEESDGGATADDADAGQPPASPRAAARTPRDRVADLRVDVAAQLALTRGQVEALSATAHAHGLPPVENATEWMSLYVSAGDIQASINAWRPAAVASTGNVGQATTEDGDEGVQQPGVGGEQSSHSTRVAS